MMNLDHGFGASAGNGCDAIRMAGGPVIRTGGLLNRVLPASPAERSPL